MKLVSLIAVLALGFGLNACGKAKYGFTGKKAEPKEDNQNFTQNQPQGNVSPNEYRGLDGFWIKGTPGTVELGNDVTFTGSCGDKKGILNWQFGDGRKASGTEYKHRYDKEGTYKIEGECAYEDGTSQKGTITITVLPKKNTGTQRPNQTPNQTNNVYQCPTSCY